MATVRSIALAIIHNIVIQIRKEEESMAHMDTVLVRAFLLGQERHPDAPPQHHAAFANSVSFAVTGWSGGYGGPSMREHWAGRLILQAGMLGAIDFDRAIALVEEACYGPFTRDMALMLCEEHCFDDAPGEQEEAIRLQIEIGEDTEDR